MGDNESDELVNRLLSADDNQSITSDENVIRKTPHPMPASYYIGETMWSSVSWQLEVCKKLMNCSPYSAAVFDVVYVALLIMEFFFNDYTSLHRLGGVPFTVFFLFFFLFNAIAPMLGMHLIKSIILQPSLPVVFQKATKYDQKFHFRMHCLAHGNCSAALLAVLLSFFTNPLYRSIQLPFLIFYVVSLSFTLSVVVSMLEGHRLLACQFIENVENGTRYLKSTTSDGDIENNEGIGNLTGLSIDIDFYKLRNDYHKLHLQFDLVRKNWGLELLFIIVSLLLFNVGLIWYTYISDFNSVKFSLVLPYIVISMFALCQVMFALTFVNEIGASVSRTLAKFIFKSGENPPLNNKGTTAISDVNSLLILSQIILIQIPFVEGFSLRVRLTAVLVGPLIGSIIPKLLS